MAVNPNDGGVDHRILHVRLVAAGVEKPFENIGSHPVSKPNVDRVPFAERWRQVSPRASRPGDPQDGFDEQPIVSPAAPRISRLAQTVRLHPRPLGVGQNESVHPQLESRQTACVNPVSQQTLVRLPVVGEDELAALLEAGWRLQAPKRLGGVAGARRKR